MNILEADIHEAGYGKKVVLRNVSISVRDGEIVGLMGPNGAGKSTLLKVLIGTLKPNAGAIHYQGGSLAGNNPEQNVRLGISFVPQGNRVFTELSVRENLEVGAYLLHDQSEVEARIQSLLDLFPDLAGRSKQNAGKLSGGEKQQLALARALMLKPKLLLLDEPSLGLAPKLVTQAMTTIQRINQEAKTAVIVVEQKVHELMRIAHRVYGLRMGEVVFDGNPDELATPDALKRIFL